MAQSGKVDWSKLVHAGGKATNVPRLLKALGASSPAERRKALAQLRSDLLEEQFFPATAEIAAPVVEMVSAPDQPGKEDLLLLLADLATGDAFVHLREGQGAAAVKKLKGPRKKAYEAVTAGAPVYTELLGSDSPRVRGAAAFLLAFLPEHAAASAKAVQAAIAKETDESALATEVIALGYLARYAGKKVDGAQVFDKYRSSDRPLLHAAGTIAAVVSGGKVTGDVVSALGEATALPSSEPVVFPWASGRPYIHALALLSTLGDEAKAAVPVVARNLEAAASAGAEAPQDGKPEALASGLLSIAFADFGDRGADRVLLNELDDEQKKLLALFSKLGVQVEYEQYGLPERVEALKDFLVPGKALALDKAVKHGGKSSPLWKWMALHFDDELDDDELLAILTKQLSKRELFDAMTEAATRQRDVAAPNEAILTGAVAALGKEAVPWAKERADALAREEKPSTPLSLFLLLLLARHGEKPLPDAYAPLAKAMGFSNAGKKTKQAILDAMSPAVRASLAK